MRKILSNSWLLSFKILDKRLNPEMTQNPGLIVRNKYFRGNCIIYIILIYCAQLVKNLR